MLGGQNKKGWHVLDQQKSKYFLVDIIKLVRNGEKTIVKFHGDTYEIPSSQLLSYQPNKSNKLQELDCPNKAEIIDWMMQNGLQQRWVKLNSRLVLDFHADTQKQRLQHISYLLGRFLVSYRKKQYLLVANDTIQKSSQHTIHQILIQALSQITSLWPYALSLNTLNTIYKAFFSGMPIKFKIFIKQSQIIKISIVPYDCQSKELLGEQSTNSFEILCLKSPIFTILSGSPRDMKRYYKIPERIHSVKSEFTVNNLFDSLLEIGLKSGEINQLIGLFVLILNINQLELQRTKKQGKHYYKIKEGTQNRENLSYWLGQQLLNELEKELNSNNGEENELKDVRIKQYILMRFIWLEAVRFAANLLNSKMINFNANYTEEVRQFIFVQFPAIRVDFQQSIQNEKLVHINQNIKRVALKVPNSNKMTIMNQEKIEKKIKQEYGYDINKDILRQLEKSRQCEIQLKISHFMSQFKIKKLKLSQFQQRQNNKKYSLAELFQQINLLQKQEHQYFVNFIIRAEINKNLPRVELLQQIQSSIEQKQRLSQQATVQNDNQDWIELKSSTFEVRYKYCEMTKSICAKKLSIFDGLEIYFSKNPTQGKVKEINQNQIAFLSFQKYKQLEAERRIHDIKSDKIKKQFKRFKYRKQFVQSVHKAFLKIKFFKAIFPKIYSPMKEALTTVRKHASSNIIIETLANPCFKIYKAVFYQIKKRAAIEKMQKVGMNFGQMSLQNIKLQFYRKLQSIKSQKRKAESAQNINKTLQNSKQRIKKECLQEIAKAIQQKQKKLKAGKNYQQGALKLSSFILKYSFQKVRNCSRIKHNTLNVIAAEKIQKVVHESQQNYTLKSNNSPTTSNLNSPPKSTNKEDKNQQLQQVNNSNSLNEKFHLSLQDANPTHKNQSSSPPKVDQSKTNANTTQSSIHPKQIPQNQSQPMNSPTFSNQQEPVIHINEPLQPLQPLDRQLTPPNTLQSNQINLIQKQHEMSLIKQENNENSAGQYTSRYSNAPSSVGFQKSETSRPISKEELYSLKDHPKFSFEIWQKQAKGFQRKKPIQSQNQPIVKLLFNKPEVKRPSNVEPPQQLNVDILIKQKVVLNPFFPYLMDHITASSEQQLQKIMSHQHKQIKQPLLKKYPLKQYAKVPSFTFNNILKIGKDKNTTKSTVLMINEILKPIRESYNKSQKVATVFDGEPSLVTDYSWSHNIVKDEIFLQFIKQIMMNQSQESLRQLIYGLQIITRYYYPSPQFIYAFLHYLKSLQSKNIQKLNECFTNTLLFAQAYQKYKGNSVTILKEEVLPKEKESYNRLLMRNTEIAQEQISGLSSITLRLFNQQKFQFKIRNENLSLFKRKVLKVLNLLPYQDYFGLYYCKNKGNGMILIQDNIKAVDFVNKNRQTEQENILYLRIKLYFPFNLKEINKTKMFYLNSLVQQRYLPWKEQNYQNVVALSMLFDQFQQYRITNYVLLSGQEANQNLSTKKIEAKYNEFSSQKGQKVNEIQYFKVVKQNDFLAAKAYRIKEQLLSPLGLVTKLVIKPLELCFYQDNDLKSSVSLTRIKAYYFEKGSVNMQIELKESGGQCLLRQLALSGIQKAFQFYLDLSTYIEYLIDK